MIDEIFLEQENTMINIEQTIGEEEQFFDPMDLASSSSSLLLLMLKLTMKKIWNWNDWNGDDEDETKD